MHLTKICLLVCALFTIVYTKDNKEKKEEKEWYYRKTKAFTSYAFNARTYKYSHEREKYFGPEDWGEVSKVCKDGKAQSPINIISKKATKTKFGSLKLKFKTENNNDLFSGSFENNGHAPTFTLNAKSGNISIKFDKKKYLLHQFHFHFGCKDSQGSEHTIDKKAYDAEMHLVFRNKKYKFEKATQKKDGLLVIGVLIKKSGFYNNNGLDGLQLLGLFSVLVHGVPKITTDLSLKKLIPALAYKKKQDAPAYYTYKGSLTTPGCYESVRWVILKEPIKIGSYLMNIIRRLQTKIGHSFKHLCNNYRPTQKINKRKVEIFESKKKKNQNEDEESEDAASGSNVGSSEDDGSSEDEFD